MLIIKWTTKLPKRILQIQSKSCHLQNPTKSEILLIKSLIVNLLILMKKLLTEYRWVLGRHRELKIIFNWNLYYHSRPTFILDDGLTDKLPADLFPKQDNLGKEYYLLLTWASSRWEWIGSFYVRMLHLQPLHCLNQVRLIVSKVYLLMWKKKRIEILVSILFPKLTTHSYTYLLLKISILLIIIVVLKYKIQTRFFTRKLYSNGNLLTLISVLGICEIS